MVENGPDAVEQNSTTRTPAKGWGGLWEADMAEFEGRVA